MKQFGVNIASRVLPRLLNTHGKQRLSILIYHRVLPTFDHMRPDEPTIVQFDWQMRLLQKSFTPLSLLEGVQRMADGTLPERAVCVTFDDGYADNAQCALPVLSKYGVPASVFISTAFINGGRMWNDSVREALRICAGDTLDLRDLELDVYPTLSPEDRFNSAEAIIRSIKHRDPELRGRLVEDIEKRVGELPSDLMLTDTQLQSLASAGVTIGAHTVNHPILASVSDHIAESEIAKSKEQLESLLQKDVEVFAYPNGTPGTDYRVEHRDMVERLGFKAAVSTHWGVSTALSDRYQLPRFTPWDREELKFTLRLLASYRRIDPLLTAG
ncbi:MAG: peptidoglycan/xylan/chitin deacetylase (PgdA/CDA1 family) [Halioglobus sp.]